MDFKNYSNCTNYIFFNPEMLTIPSLLIYLEQSNAESVQMSMWVCQQFLPKKEPWILCLSLQSYCQVRRFQVFPNKSHIANRTIISQSHTCHNYRNTATHARMRTQWLLFSNRHTLNSPVVKPAVGAVKRVPYLLTCRMRWMMAGGAIKLDMLFKTFIVSSFSAEERKKETIGIDWALYI